MGQPYKLAGGTTGQEEVSQSNWIGFFEKGVVNVTPSQKNSSSINGRILPAFDLEDMSREDEDFKKSYIPYRYKNSDFKDQKTNTEAFTSWFFVVKGYRFLGNTNASFLSPQTLKAAGDGFDVSDPIYDCLNWVKRQNDPDLKKYTESQKDSQSGYNLTPIIPKAHSFALLNFYGDGGPGGGMENYILSLKITALEDLKDMLSVYTPYIQGVEPYDPDWPQYLLGDVTHPERGLAAGCRLKTSSSESGFKFLGLQFSSDKQKLQDHRPMPVNEKVLENRYDIPASIKILGYQDIVNHIVEDGAIPYDIIQRACSDRADVPPPPSKGKPTTKTSSEPKEAAPTEARVSNAKAMKYWACVNGEVSKQPVDQDTVMTEVNDGKDVKLISIEDMSKGGGWMNASYYGFEKKVAEPTPPPPPPAETQAPPPPPVENGANVPPPPPSDNHTANNDTPPSAPSGDEQSVDTPPQTSSGKSLTKDEEEQFEALSKKVTEDGANLTAEEATLFASLAQKIESSKG